MRIYLSGPMRGYPKLNWPAFDQAAAGLRAQGHFVYNPADFDRLNYGTLEAMEAVTNGATRETLRLLGQQDTFAVMASDAIALLPGFERSTGARMEFFLARFLQNVCLDANGKLIPPDLVELQIAKSIIDGA